ncbi:MAG TPA: hypothetical protein VKX41_15180 [Alloacidobacterium sp.]|jgi:hypothetical protein|nr:hypothetical protein [Alloacidobacterium sp.]
MEKLRGNRTTWIGILTIAGALIQAGIAVLQHQHVDWTMLYSSVSTGLVAIHAADAKQ